MKSPPAISRAASRLRGALWVALTAILVSSASAKGPQPMLLSPGKVSLNSKSPSVRVPAKCLDDGLIEPPRGHHFTHSTKGIKVTRRGGNTGAGGAPNETVDLEEAINRDWVKPAGDDSMDQVVFELGDKGKETGAEFDIDVSADVPQYLATGADQVAETDAFLTERGSGLTEFAKERSRLEKLFGKDGTDSIYQEVLWALRNEPRTAPAEVIREEVEKHLRGLGLPKDLGTPGVEARLQLAWGRKITPEESQLMKEIHGKPLVTGPTYEEVLRLQPAGDGYTLWDGQQSITCPSLPDACRTIRGRRPPTRHVVYAKENPIFGRALKPIEAEQLARHGVTHVVDSDYFAAHGLPPEPKRIIVFASRDPRKNKIIFKDQNPSSIKRSLAHLSVLGDKVRYVDSEPSLRAAFAGAESDSAAPWIIGHSNNKGEFILSDGRISIFDLPEDAVKVTCNLYKVEARQAMRTTGYMDFEAVCKSLAQADIKSKRKLPGNRSATEDNTEYFTAFGDNYASEMKGRKRQAQFSAVALLSSIAGPTIYAISGDGGGEEDENEPSDTTEDSTPKSSKHDSPTRP